jgi:hypothetical protein
MRGAPHSGFACANRVFGNDTTTSRLAQLGNEAPSHDYLQNDESVLIELTPRYGTANTPVVPSVFVSVS